MQEESSHRKGLFLSFFYILGPKYNVLVPGFEIYVKVRINSHLQFLALIELNPYLPYYAKKNCQDLSSNHSHHHLSCGWWEIFIHMRSVFPHNLLRPFILCSLGYSSVYYEGD